jgi:hypothetical protein
MMAPYGIRFSPFFMAHTGTPFNITTGTDLYGTGQTSSTVRPSVVGGPGPNTIDTPFGFLNVVPQPGEAILRRNAGTGPGYVDLNLRLSRTWGFGRESSDSRSSGATSRGGDRGGNFGRGGRGLGETSTHRYNLTLSIMARNILNHANLSTPVGVVTSPFFLESTGITGGFGPQSVASNQRRLDLQIRFSF